MKSSRILGRALCAGALVTAAMILATAAGPEPVRLSQIRLRSHVPIRIHQQRERGSWESYNWSGYAVTGANGSVTDVYSSWVVPAVNCSAAPTGYSAFWVGIDGFTSSTVEQIGTDSDCVSLNGRQTDTPTYYAWYEFYPQGSYLVGLPRGVQPGDTITAEVKYIGQVKNPRRGGTSSEFTATITDVTQNETFSVTSTVSGAAQSSAEWIAEAPCCSRGNTVLPLSDFGIVNFNSGTTTVGGAAGPIGSFGANVQSITMVGEKNSTLVKAQLSGLSGGSFLVSWLNPGP